MRRRASSIGALSASTIAFFSSPTIRTSQRKGEILSGRIKDQNIGYCPEYLMAVGTDWPGS